MSNKGLDDLLADGIRKREEEEQAANDLYAAQVEEVVGQILLKVHDAKNSDNQLEELQAILSGSGTVVTVEKEVADPELQKELDKVTAERDKLKQNLADEKDETVPGSLAAQLKASRMSNGSQAPAPVPAPAVAEVANKEEITNLLDDLDNDALKVIPHPMKSGSKGAPGRIIDGLAEIRRLVS